jgi:hypothetical protein
MPVTQVVPDEYPRRCTDVCIDTCKALFTKRHARAAVVVIVVVFYIVFTGITMGHVVHNTRGINDLRAAVRTFGTNDTTMDTAIQNVTARVSNTDVLLSRVDAREVARASMYQKQLLDVQKSLNTTLATVQRMLTTVQQDTMRSKDLLKASVATMLQAHVVPVQGEVRLFVVHVCPKGWTEVPLQGYVLVSRPIGAKPGTVLNRPLVQNETGRVGRHGHTVTVTDPGHVHMSGIFTDGNNEPGPHAQVNADKKEIHTARATTGVKVTVQNNSGGEDLPLMYILMCTPSPP